MSPCVTSLKLQVEAGPVVELQAAAPGGDAVFVPTDLVIDRIRVAYVR